MTAYSNFFSPRSSSTHEIRPPASPRPIFVSHRGSRRISAPQNVLGTQAIHSKDFRTSQRSKITRSRKDMGDFNPEVMRRFDMKSFVKKRGNMVEQQDKLNSQERDLDGKNLSFKKDTTTQKKIIIPKKLKIKNKINHDSKHKHLNSVPDLSNKIKQIVQSKKCDYALIIPKISTKILFSNKKKKTIGHKKALVINRDFPKNTTQINNCKLNERK